MFGSGWDQIRFPMTADVYYSRKTQNGFGEMQLQWIYDRTIKCSAISAMSDKTLTGELKATSAFNQPDSNLYFRSKEDSRISSKNVFYNITSVLITNIRDPKGNIAFLFKQNDPMKFEIQTIVPSYNVNHEIDYYRHFLSRSDIQIGDLVK
jgi:hypothetical protein